MKPNEIKKDMKVSFSLNRLGRNQQCIGYVSQVDNKGGCITFSVTDSISGNILQLVLPQGAALWDVTYNNEYFGKATDLEGVK